MKRRELLKSTILGLSATAVALSGCDKKSEKTACENNEDELNIIPKQTATYEFSCPLPFNYKTIDEIYEMNKGFKKSQVTSFYNNAPNQNFNNWISIDRARNDNFKSYDKFFEFTKYASDRGIRTTYLMNSPKPFSMKDFETFEKEFYYLLDELLKNNVRDVKIANPQVAFLINERYGNEFNLHCSTALEYNLINQYEYLFINYPNFNLIDVANGENQNFRFLNELRNKFPKIKIELMVNESCIKGCPARISHISENEFCAYNCRQILRKIGYIHYFLKTGAIYPWNLEYYSAIGINNFKFIASNWGQQNTRSNYHNITSLKDYLSCIEYGINNLKIENFFNSIFEMLQYTAYKNLKNTKQIELTELKVLLPDVKYFIKHGHECAIKCNNGCNYCYECAKKLEKKLLYG